MPNKAISLEIACFTLESAVIAAEAGAHRIELCGGPASSGGLTPSLTDLQTLKDKIKIPAHVMIRPRAGNFVYTADEIGSMKTSMAEMRQWADGFVFGVLNEEDEVDIAQCQELLSVAGDTPCIFHRAVECVNDAGQVYSLIKKLGFKAVLTGGKQPTAVESVAELAEITTHHERSGLQIIVGGGVRAGNIGTLLENTRARWYHTSALVNGGDVASSNEIARMLEIMEKVNLG